jgi:hypothetical protein
VHPAEPPDSDLDALTSEIAGYVRERQLAVAVSLRVDPIWLRMYLVNRYLTTLGVDPGDPIRDSDIGGLAFGAVPDPAGDFIEDGLAFDLSMEMTRWHRWCEITGRPLTPLQCEVQVYVDPVEPELGQPPQNGEPGARVDGRPAIAREIRDRFGSAQPIRIVLRGALPRLHRCPQGRAVGPALGAALPGTLGGLVRIDGGWAAATVSHVMHPQFADPATMSAEGTVADETTLLHAAPALLTDGVPVRIGHSSEVESGNKLWLHGLTSGHSAGEVVGRFASFPLRSTKIHADGTKVTTTVHYGRCYQLQNIRHTIFGVKARPVSRDGDSGAWMVTSIGGELVWVGTLVGGDAIQSAATYVEAFPPVAAGRVDAAMVIPDCGT